VENIYRASHKWVVLQESMGYDDHTHERVVILLVLGTDGDISAPLQPLEQTYQGSQADHWTVTTH